MEIVLYHTTHAEHWQRQFVSALPSLLMSIRNSWTPDHTQLQLTNVYISLGKMGKEMEEGEKGEWHWSVFKWIFRQRTRYVPEEQSGDVSGGKRVGQVPHSHAHSCHVIPEELAECSHPAYLMRWLTLQAVWLQKILYYALGRAGRLCTCWSLPMPTHSAGMPRNEKVVQKE